MFRLPYIISDTGWLTNKPTEQTKSHKPTLSTVQSCQHTDSVSTASCSTWIFHVTHGVKPNIKLLNILQFS